MWLDLVKLMVPGTHSREGIETVLLLGDTVEFFGVAVGDAARVEIVLSDAFDAG